MTRKRHRVELSAHWISSRSKQTIMNIKASQTITWTRAVNSPAPLSTAPASPHLHPWISYLACLLLSFSSPLSPSSSLNTRGEGALPLFFLPPLFFLRQATHSITLTTPQKPTPPPPHCYLNLHSNECAIPRPPSNPPLFFSHGGLPWGWGGGKEESSACTHTISVAKTQHPPTPTHPSCVYVCAHLQRNTGTWWVTDVRWGELGGVLMALSAGNGLLLHRQLQSQQSSQASSTYFICIGKTHVHSQLGRVSPSHRLMTMQNCSCRAKKNTTAAVMKVNCKESVWGHVPVVHTTFIVLNLC